MEKQANNYQQMSTGKTKIYYYISGFVVSFFMGISSAFAQAEIFDTTNNKLEYSKPQLFEIANVEIVGVNFLDKNSLQILSGLNIGKFVKIPGEDISKAIEILWKQNLFEDIKIYLAKVEDGKAWIEIHFVEKSRLSAYATNLNKKDNKKLREELGGFLKTGNIVNENLINKTKNETIAYFYKKGYMNASVDIKEEKDHRKNFVLLKISVNKGNLIKINDIIFTGNQYVSTYKLRQMLKETKKVNYNILKKSKYIENDFENDKKIIIEKYLAMGYRDAKIVSDTIYSYSRNRINVQINIDEGHQYFFRHVYWTGNTKYSNNKLDTVLGIKRGDIYNQSILESRMSMNPQGVDIASLYMDDGYLFYNATPVEVLVENDSIDIEIRMNEGPQAIVNNVTIRGNTKTSDHVILRELYVRPGYKFSRSDVSRSIRELSQLSYFNPEKIGVNPMPNANTGTVDIEFTVEEKSSDQIELSGGYGGYGGLVGVLGLTLNNFSAKKMLKKKEWTPLPGGDGQRLQIRAQSNGSTFRSTNLSFTEPWLGGKRPNSFSVSAYHSVQSQSLLIGGPKLKTTGVTISLGRRLKKPDDYFTILNSLNYQRFDNYKFSFGTGRPLPDGVFNDFNTSMIISRSSVNEPIYPRSGSDFMFSVQATLPYSKFTPNANYQAMPDAERLKFLEYHKWKFNAKWYTTIFDKLVLATRANFGFVGNYTLAKGLPPFNRFSLGGSGLTGYNLDGREVISARGYADGGSLSVHEDGYPSAIYNRFTMELRFPAVLSPSLTFYGLGFVEAANGYNSFKTYNPFATYRAAGVGIRLFLPMFGLLGLDYAYNFDVNSANPANHWQTHFFLGQQF